MGRSYKEGQDVNRASEDVERLRDQLSDLERQLEAQRAPSAPPNGPETRGLLLRTAAPFCAYSSKDEIAGLHFSIDPMTEELETISIRPKKTNITVRKVALVWRA